MSDALYQAPGFAPRSATTARQGGELACQFEIVDAGELATLPPEQWDALSSDLLEDNPYFSRAIVLAGLEALDDAKGMKALVLRARCDGSLAGLLPFRVRGLGPMAVAQPSLNLYQIGGTPLIARRHAQEAVSTIARLMAQGRTLPRRWIFAHMDTDGPFIRSFARAGQAVGLTAQAATTYKRAVLTRSAGDFETHVETVIGRKRARDVQRNLRRLSELGEVTFERATDPETVAERIDAFLKLENAGWKGARGTAFLSRPDHAAFARAAFAPGLALVDSLLLDGIPIAVSVNIGEGRTLFTPKCAFDETYRKYGPGMVLEYLVVRDFFSQERYDEMDASTTVDGHVIAGFWNAQKTMGTVVIGPGCQRTKLLQNAISASLGGKARIKALLGRK